MEKGFLKYLWYTVFEIRENNHCVRVIFQAGNPESMLKNPPSTVIISSYFEHWVYQKQER